MEKKKQYTYPQKFRQAWLNDPHLKDWLRENVDKPKGSYCVYCKCELVSKYCDLRSHAATKKHLKAAVASQQQQLTDSLPLIMMNMTNELEEKIAYATDRIEIEPIKTKNNKNASETDTSKPIDAEPAASTEYHETLHIECPDEDDEEFTEILNLADDEFEALPNTALREKRIKAEIAYFQQKTEYFAKLTENAKIHKTLMLLQARKLNLEIKKMQNEL